MRAITGAVPPAGAERYGATSTSARAPGQRRTLRLPPELRRQLSEWVCAGYPHETCGLLIGKAGGLATEVDEVVQARNLNRERPGDRYELNPADFAAADHSARARGLEIVGIWHSHPDHSAVPSQTDRAGAWVGWSYLIASVGPQGPAGLRSWWLHGHAFVEEVIEP